MAAPLPNAIQATIVAPVSTGLLALDQTIATQGEHGRRLDRVETALADLQHAKARDSQHELESALEEANELLRKREEAARHWTRWAAQILVSLIVGAILLLLGKYLGGKHSTHDVNDCTRVVKIA